MNSENPFTTEQLLLLWGKTNRPANTAYHPLLFHMLDVGLCAGRLWDRLPRGTRWQIASGLGLKQWQARRALMILAGLHDLGKACPPFQSQSDVFRGQVRRAGLTIRHDAGDYNRPHGTVSTKEIIRLLSTPGGPLKWYAPKEVATILAVIAGGHHGVFPTPEEILRVSPQSLGDDAWQTARDNLSASLLAALFTTNAKLSQITTEAKFDQPLIPLLAGLISVADWMGSSKHFTMNGTRPIEKYRRASQYAANTALNRAGWSKPFSAPGQAPFENVFSYLRKTPVEANEVQKAVSATVKNETKPYLLIIESAMGSGKTEAALYALDCAMVNKLIHGFYVALPTQATSNAMHARISDYFEKGKRLGSSLVNLLLVHANAELDEKYQSLIVDAPIYDSGLGQVEVDGQVIAQRWFTEQKKQALLAPFGVGTIDQALLCVLQTRHWFVRLFGLAGKAIVFDEVHAYDVYMTTILERLISWLAALRCPVILLSATLPTARQLDLAEAYRVGAKAELISREGELARLDTPASYPRLTFVTCDKSEVIAIDEKAGECKPPVTLERHVPDPQGIFDAIMNTLPDGGSVAVICNTVDRAQEVYLYLRDKMRPQWEVDLFHARTPFIWRKEKEDCVLRWFGKDSGNNGKEKRRNRVLVATQVIEQSLDLDFDLMFSDFCPIDLLLQRMGRLFRHDRKRSPGLLPHFIILCDGEVNGTPPAFVNAQIYDRYILLRSWLATQSLPNIDLHAEIHPLVAEVYVADQPVKYHAVSPEHLAEWAHELESELRLHKKDMADYQSKAERFLVAEPDTFTHNAFNKQLDDSDDPAAHTSVRAATRDPEQLSFQVICFGTSKELKPLSKNYRPSNDLAKMRAMRQFSISLHQERIYHAVKDKQKPGWHDNSTLRYCYPLEFQHGVNAELKLTLSAELGLVVGRSEK